MKVDCDNVFIKVCFGVVLCCLLAANAFAVLVEPIKQDELKSMNKNITSIKGSSHSFDNGTLYSSDLLSQKKSFAIVDSVKEDGQLFFEMRRQHLLASESSAAALLLLGFFGFFSRRWL